MWSEIARNDSESITRFIAIQGEMNDHYRENLTPDFIDRLFDRKRQLRIFMYDDGQTQLSLAFYIHVSGALKLATTAIGDYIELADSVRIAHEKTIQIVAEYEADSAYALWDIHNSDKGDLYFSRMADAITAKANGFKDAVTTNPTERINKTVWTI